MVSHLILRIGFCAVPTRPSCRDPRYGPAAYVRRVKAMCAVENGTPVNQNDRRLIYPVSATRSPPGSFLDGTVLIWQISRCDFRQLAFAEHRLLAFHEYLA